MLDEYRKTNCGIIVERMSVLYYNKRIIVDYTSV